MAKYDEQFFTGLEASVNTAVANSNTRRYP
jgi:hypothetical protein